VKHQIIFNKTLSSLNLLLKLDHLTKNLDFYHTQLNRLFKAYFEKQEKTLSTLSQMLEAYSFKKTLDRGFALIRSEDGNVVSSTKEFLKYPTLRVMLKDGEIKFSPK
jgi:exonuclease VII large subunit